MMVIKNRMRHIFRELLKPNIHSKRSIFEQHLEASVDWIRRAHKAAGDGGISKGYDLLRGRWSPSYPETTGYTIPTLLNASAALKQADLADLAISLADFLLQNTTQDGAVVHWQDKAKATPIVFDTGQVIFGWLAAFEHTGNDGYLDAARMAGDWLVASQNEDGYWEKGQYKGVVKVIDTRVAWALVNLSLATEDKRYRQAAERNLNWAMTQQNELGWFKKCAFLPGDDPITHTLAYTAEGLLESGLSLNDEKYISSARKLADALLHRQRSDGSLASTYRSDWSASSRSSCLTGNCQMGRLWLRFYQQTAKSEYYQAAQRAITFVANHQDLETSVSSIHGAVAGSYPIYGHYERFKYPNWAVKFFIDSILTLDFIDSRRAEPHYLG